MAMTIRFHDLKSVQLADGTIRLTQQAGIDEPSVIDLHPAQLLHLAGIVRGKPVPDVGIIADLERRLGVLVDKLQEVVCDRGFRDDILERCGDGLYWLAKLDAVTDLALEYDGGRLHPEDFIDDKPVYPPSASPSTNAAPPQIAPSIGNGPQT